MKLLKQILRMAGGLAAVAMTGTMKSRCMRQLHLTSSSGLPRGVLRFCDYPESTDGD